MSDTTIPLASRRRLLQPNIAHLELASPEYKQAVVIETKYSDQKGAWVLRLVRGLKGEQSRADILIITSQEWALHNEASGDHIGNGRIAPMPNIRDFPRDDNVESQAAARLAKAQAAQAQARAKESSAMDRHATAPVENVQPNNHLQPWMVDQTLSSQLAAYSGSLSVAVAKFQQIMSDTTIPLASRRRLLQPNIAHLELASPEYKQAVVIETKYSDQKGAWVLRLVRGLKGEQSRADILIITSQEWALHNEASGDPIGNGRIAPMPNIRDFPKDDNVESQAAVRLTNPQSTHVMPPFVMTVAPVSPELHSLRALRAQT